MRNEKEVIASVLNGNTADFALIIDANKDAVFSVLLNMTASKENSEDIAQEVFIKVFKQLRQFKGQSKLSTWIYRIAYFEGLNFLRKRKELTRSFDNQQFSEADYSVLDNIDRDDRASLINEALGYLKPIERTIIQLYYLEELTLKELCEITNQTKSNCKVILFRARKKLYSVLSKTARKEVLELIKN